MWMVYIDRKIREPLTTCYLFIYIYSICEKLREKKISIIAVLSVSSICQLCYFGSLLFVCIFLFLITFTVATFKVTLFEVYLFETRNPFSKTPLLLVTNHPMTRKLLQELNISTIRRWNALIGFFLSCEGFSHPSSLNYLPVTLIAKLCPLARYF